MDKGNYLGWRPFVFQHGLGGDVSQPAGVFPPPRGFRLISLDCRGHGGTRPLGPADKLSVSSFADDVVALEAVRARFQKALDEAMESAHRELLPLGLSEEQATDWSMYVTGEALRRDRA